MARMPEKGRSRVIGGEKQDFFPCGRMDDKIMRGETRGEVHKKHSVER